MTKPREIQTDEAYAITRLFILDEETKFLVEGQVGTKIIISEEELQSISDFKDHLEDVIILCELNWGDKFLQQFHGFEIARELRMRHKLLCPIVFVSTLKRSYFEELAARDARFAILFGTGTGFVELDKMNEDLEKSFQFIPALSEAALADLNEMLLNLKGLVVDRLTHDLQVGMNENDVKGVMTTVASYLAIHQKAAIGWNEYENRLIQNLTNAVEFNKIKEELILKCKQELGDTEVTTVVVPSKRRHKILLVEDDTGFRKRLEENLKNDFELVVTSTAEEAISELDKDGTNSIVGVIADWRLYRDNSRTYWQQLQGYEVLDHAAKARFAALFALTAEDDWNVHNIRNLLGLDVHLFKKEHLKNEGQWDLMNDVVKQKCDMVLDVIAFQPSGAKWTLDYYDKPDGGRVNIRSLKAKYQEQRNFGWSVFENGISTKSDDVWNYYKVVLGQPLENAYVSALKEKFGFELDADDPLLESILIARRVYLALWFNAKRINQTIYVEVWNSKARNSRPLDDKEIPSSVHVYCVLNGTSWGLFLENFQEKKEAGKNKLSRKEQAWKSLLKKSRSLAYQLCIRTENLPGGILPEEHNWLKKQGIDKTKGNPALDYTTIEDQEDEEDSGIQDINVEPTDEELRRIDAQSLECNEPVDDDDE